ncbi:reverse transcriptase domain-containing protein [Tanacetum coccineum]
MKNIEDTHDVGTPKEVVNDSQNPTEVQSRWDDPKVHAVKGSFMDKVDKELDGNDDGVTNTRKSFVNMFTSSAGVEQVLQQGPWMIRGTPIILNKWTQNLSLSKDGVTKVPFWVKIHKVPIVAYSEDGLSLIGSQIGKPIMLDVFTSVMYVDTWGRISYARALIENNALKPTDVAQEKENLEEQIDGFTIVVNKKKKRKKGEKSQEKNIEGLKFNKPKSKFSYQPKDSETISNAPSDKPNVQLKNKFTNLQDQDGLISECEVGESSEGNSNDVIFEEPDSNHVESESKVEELHVVATCTGDDIKGASTPSEEVLNV